MIDIGGKCLQIVENEDVVSWLIYLLLLMRHAIQSKGCSVVITNNLFYSLIYEWKQTGKSKRLNDMLKQIPANKSDKKRICEL